MDTVNQFHLVKVDEQPNRDIGQFHVAQELSLVDGENFLHGLCFHQSAIFDQQIKPQRFFAGEALVGNQDDLLAQAGQPAQFKLFRQTPFVDGFDQAGCFVAVHFNGPAMMVSINPDAFSNKGCIEEEITEETETFAKFISVNSVSSC